MSSLNQPNTPNGDPSEEPLRDWGAVERTLPPLRRGRFSNVMDRLTRGTTPSPKQNWFNPSVLIGGVTLVAVSAALVQLCNYQLEVTSQTVPMPPEALDAVGTPASSTTTREARTKALQKATHRFWGEDFSVSANPVFGSRFLGAEEVLVGQRQAMVPFVVTITNKGAARDARIIVSSGGAGPDRIYTYPIHIPANTELNKTVYGAFASIWQRSQGTVALEMGGRHVTLHSINQSQNGSGAYDPVIAVLDERRDVLSPRFDNWKHNNKNYTPFFALPENAPDRAQGYDAVDMVVLGKNSENLNAAQWNALRDWVAQGGSLVLVGKGEGSQALQATVAQDLSPLMPDGTLKPNAGRFTPPYNLDNIPQLASGTSAISHTFGMGTVICLRFDPFTREIRNNADTVSRLWNSVTQIVNRTDFSARSLRSNANDSPWYGKVYDPKSSDGIYTFERPGTALAARDPFREVLPPLQTVVYIFLGYFVFVVPVTFVVLKQTRRMQYAWFTGPILATLTAGGIALFTTSLYTIPRSARTTGLVTLMAGEGKARFHGFTELYAPHGGRFALDFPGTQRSLDSSGYHSEYTPNDYNNQATLGSISTTDDGNGEAPIKLDMPNLSFRRVFHQETISLGKGITANLHIDTSGALIGTLHNNTGLPLRNVSIVLRDKKSQTVKRYQRQGTPYQHEMYQVYWYKLASLASGNTTIRVLPEATSVSKNITDDDEMLAFPATSLSYWSKQGISTRDFMSLSPTQPILFAQTGGEAFGPQGFGQSVGGDSSVNILVRLPALTSDSKSASLKGGNVQ